MAALVFPGLGHLILGKWIRAVLLASSILGLFCLGLAVDGKLHGMDASELIAMLYFFADASNGLPYLMAKNWGYGAGNAQSQSFRVWEHFPGSGRSAEPASRSECFRYFCRPKEIDAWNCRISLL